VITQAVTKGLDPNVPMKDSGVQWLGEVPAHWRVMKTKYVARLESGHTPSRNHPEYWENCRIPWFGLADVWQIRDDRKEYVGDTKERVSALGLAHSSARLLPAGTVILSRTASVGFSGIMAIDMATTQDFADWVPSREITPEYLLYVFRSMRGEFRRLTMGSTHQTIYMPDIAAFTTPVPPIDEQEAIVEATRSRLSRIDLLVDLNASTVELLTERRSALITAAVTGQIDVRDAA
jgi:type I restriction enzyme S subunit